MHKLNVILDLDQTLISAEEIDKFNFQKFKNKMNLFQYEQLDDDYLIFARPHLQEFLDYLFKNFNVSIWTAATKGYALFIIDKFIKIKANRKLDFIFFSYHCDFSMKRTKKSKCLDILSSLFNIESYNLSRTFIIDDNDEVKQSQSCNCYHVKPFYFVAAKSDEDKVLLELISKLENLKNTPLNSKTLCLTDLIV
jgi:TFIIF-interacting CTD phosphatase-like protein